MRAQASTRPSTLVVVLVLFAVLEGVALIVLSTVLGYGAEEFFGAYAHVNVMFAFGGSLLSGAILARHPRHVIGWSLLAIAVGTPLMVVGGLVADLATEPSTPIVALDSITLVLASLPAFGWVPFVVILLVVIPLHFPTGRLPSSRWRPVLWLAAVAGGLLTLAFELSSPLALSTSQSTIAEFKAGLEPTPMAETLNNAGFPLLALAVVLSLASMVVRFRAAEGVERAQLRMVLALALIGLPIAAPLSFGDWLVPQGPVTALIAGLAAMLLPAGIGLAVLRYRLYDVDRLISRTLAYVLLTAALALVYGASVLGLSALLGGGDSPPVAVAAATLAAAALFTPLRTRLQALIDRRLFRARADATAAVAQFGERLRDRLEVADVTRDLVDVVTDVAAPNSLRVWVPSTAIRDAAVTAHHESAR